MDPLIPTATTFVVAAALFMWVGNGVARAKKTATDRLAVYGKDVLREENLTRPFAERAVAPVILGLGRILSRFTPAGYMKKIDKRLIYAGSPGTLDSSAWVVIKVLGTVAMIILWVFLQRRLPVQQKLLAGVLLIGLGFFGPDAWLQRKIDGRRESMRRALPDVLDLLVISVEAGLGFDSALARVVGTVPGPLSEEFFRMLQETRVGVSRRDAMRHLLDRTDVDELRSFLLAMLQAEAFGVTIARVLRVQADEMRVKRRQRAQEKAFAAPVKLVFPLVLCIFPALFIVILGPAALRIYDTFANL